MRRRGPWTYPSAEQPHYVYRCYDADGSLLYVGCSVRPRNRVAAHRRSAPWGDQIASVRHTVFPNRPHALAQERLAIWQENPRWNVKGLRLVEESA